MATVTDIAAKYGHKVQSNSSPSAQLVSLQKKTQAAIDNLYNAAMKARALLDEFNKANAASSYSANINTYTFTNVMNRIMNRERTKV